MPSDIFPDITQITYPIPLSRTMAMEHYENYSYSPLPEATPLRQALPFYVLSHSWGAESRTIPVVMDEKLIYVTPNISALLARLQTAIKDAELDSSSALFWIDSICINQEDISERSRQVAAMGKIYSRSIRTLVWLGPQLGSLSTAWQLIDQIYETSELEDATQSTLPVLGMTESTINLLEGSPVDLEPWIQLWHLLHLSWFSRIWVVQEVVLSPQDPIILHGILTYPWYRLENAATWLRRNGYLYKNGIPEQLRNVITMGNLRRQLTKWPLDALLSITQIKFRSTDQRDKVFALLSLAAECQTTIPEPLTPAYDIDTEKVYQRVARFLLEKGGTLAMLTRSRGTSGSDDPIMRQRQHQLEMPSWTPDWSDFRVFNNDIRTSLSWVHYSDTSKAPYLGFPNHYTASADHKIRLYDSDDQSILRLGGLKIDQVAVTIPFNCVGNSKEDFRQTFGSDICHIWDGAMSAVKSDDARALIRRFIETTTAAQYKSSGKDEEQIFADGLAYLRNLPLPWKGYGVEENEIDKLQLQPGRNPKQYVNLASNYCFFRSFIVSSTGKMGLGPSETRVGDSICVLFGGGVPYVVRSQGTKKALVGELYLEGVMSGEAIKLYNQNNFKEEVFNFV
ncbi:hypothetical protein ACLX1H_007805 [Fusarium chlamydosporum]